MDKQLVEEFNKRYFGKNELKRRIYEENELEIIWKEINGYRKNRAINIEIKLSEKNSYWYNFTDDVKLAIAYINDIEKSEITNYLSGDIDINIEFKSNIDEFYINRYGNINSVNDDIYRSSKEIGVLGELNYEVYNLKSTDSSKELFEYVLASIKSNENWNVIIKAAILHFYVIYLSPFSSNNLEMAEYISNKYLIENGYEIVGYCNILEFIKNDEKRYCNAIDNSVINDGDITYFIKYYVGIIQASIRELTKEISIKHGKKIIKELIEKNNVSLEDRQIKFVNSMVILNNNKISIDDYKKKTKVSYETARSDLNSLVAIGFFKISKSGKKYEYYFNDILTIIDNFNDISVIV